MIRTADYHQRVARRGAKESLEAGGRGPEQPQHAVLGLQRQVGNAAVARILQRTPKDRPASTDAPWIKKGRPPAKKPAKKVVPDFRSRVIKFDLVEGKNRITIAAGPDQGVEKGMSASLINKVGGSKLETFKIVKTEGGSSTAFVKTTFDQVSQNPEVIVLASTFDPESNEGKEF